jgi:hypothetical protein
MSAWLKRTCPFLFEYQMPIWLTIIVSILAATATYYGAPLINREFNIEATRAAHISQTTARLNENIIDISIKVRRLNESLENNDNDIRNKRAECLDLVTKLQWMLVDLRVVLSSGDDSASVDRLAESIKNLQTALNRAVDARAIDNILFAMGGLGQQTEEVLSRLYTHANLKD